MFQQIKRSREVFEISRNENTIRRTEPLNAREKKTFHMQNNISRNILQTISIIDKLMTEKIIYIKN